MSDPDSPAAREVRPFLHGQDHQPVRTTARAEQPPAPQPDPATVLRPFVLTAGRVAGADPEIGLETQVSSAPGAAYARLSPEGRAIVHLCREPQSVAEISAQLRLHFGVARILVGDLRAAGHLDVHVTVGDYPDPDTILRVIRGLRALP